MAGFYADDIFSNPNGRDLDWANAMRPIIAERDELALGGALPSTDHYMASGLKRSGSDGSPNREADLSANLLRRATPSVVARCALQGESILPARPGNATSPLE